MVRPNRIKSYSFRETGSIFSDANGNMALFTTWPINGTIQKIEHLGGNFTATGSLLFTVSGTGEVIFNWTSGTNQGNVANTAINYPFVYANNNAAGTGSPQAFTQYVVNDPIRVVGSGLGAGKSGLGLSIVFI